MIALRAATVARLMDKRALGREGEDAAAAFLEARGYTIVDRNVRTREGEIDIVAARDDVVAYIEVKTRSSRAYGLPAEAVTPRKAARIRRLAVAHLASSPAFARTVRFDVIEVERRCGVMTLAHREGCF